MFTSRETNGTVAYPARRPLMTLFAVVGDTRPPTYDDTQGYPTAIIQKIYGDIEGLNPHPPFMLCGVGVRSKCCSSPPPESCFATETTDAPCPSNVRTSDPVRASQMLTVASSQPVAIRAPSDLAFST